jgi:hypothetical protein
MKTNSSCWSLLRDLPEHLPVLVAGTVEAVLGMRIVAAREVCELADVLEDSG